MLFQLQQDVFLAVMHAVSDCFAHGVAEAHGIQLAVDAFALQQLGMRSLFGDMSSLKDNDAVGTFDRREAVSDDQRSTVM
jgi:hypothetical protein